jgi:hypothetical protein
MVVWRVWWDFVRWSSTSWLNVVVVESMVAVVELVGSVVVVIGVMGWDIGWVCIGFGEDVVVDGGVDEIVGDVVVIW